MSTRRSIMFWLGTTAVLGCSPVSPSDTVTSLGTGPVESTGTSGGGSTATGESTGGSESTGEGEVTGGSATSDGHTPVMRGSSSTGDPSSEAAATDDGSSGHGSGSTSSSSSGIEESSTTAIEIEPIDAYCILPLGDSITQANATHFSYRYWLWEQLVNAGWTVNFVGSQEEHHFGTPIFPNPAFDRDHEGHWGWRADNILADLPGWLAGYTPTVVILHIGTNDIYIAQSTESTLAEIAGIVEVLRADKPDVVVFISQVIPVANFVMDADALNDRIDDLNAGIVLLGPQLTTAASPVFVLGRPPEFNAVLDTYDGFHPSPSGEQKLASNFFAALETAFNAGIVDLCP